MKALQTQSKASTRFLRSMMLLLGIVFSLTYVHHVNAQAFGSKPITFVVPVPPGSITDTTARFYAERLQARIGRPVVVDNRPGGNHFIAVKAVLDAQPDGNTVLIATTSTFATNVALFKSLPYDPVKDLTPLTLLSEVPSVVVTTPGKYKTMKDLVAAAKAAPGKLNYGSGAVSYQLMSELLNEIAGIKTTNIPYKGAADALKAVMAGQVDFAVLDTTSTLGAARANRIDVIAAASKVRLKSLPEIATAEEAGLAGFVAKTWVSSVVSSKTPKEISDQLAKILTEIAQEAKTIEFLAKLGAEINSPGPDNLRQLQADEIKLWKRVATSAGVELQ